MKYPSKQAFIVGRRRWGRSGQRCLRLGGGWGEGGRGWVICRVWPPDESQPGLGHLHTEKCWACSEQLTLIQMLCQHRGSWALEQKTQITAPQTHNLHQKGRYFITQMLLYHSSSDLNINYTLNSIDTIPQNTNETIVVKYITITMNIKYVFPSRKRWKVKYGPEQETQIKMVLLWT